MVLRYFDDHHRLGFDASTKAIFIGMPSDDWAIAPKGRSLIQILYHDPSPEWLASFASSGISVLPVSHAAFTDAHPYFHIPETFERVVVFAVISIEFIDAQHASVRTSAAFAPLGGGEATFRLALAHEGWHVTDETPGPVY